MELWTYSPLTIGTHILTNLRNPKNYIELLYLWIIDRCWTWSVSRWCWTWCIRRCWAWKNCRIGDCNKGISKNRIALWSKCHYTEKDYKMGSTRNSKVILYISCKPNTCCRFKTGKLHLNFSPTSMSTNHLVDKKPLLQSLLYFSIINATHQVLDS